MIEIENQPSSALHENTLKTATWTRITVDYQQEEDDERLLLQGS